MRYTNGYKNREMYEEYEAFEYSNYGEDYRIEDELFCSETEKTLFVMFEEIDAIVLDHLPISLITEPAKLIQQEYYQKTGMFLTKQEVVDAYLRFAEGVCYD